MVDIAAPAAPTVTIYLNGNSNFYGKKFVVNRRRVRTLDAFLDNVTVDIKSSKAIRRLCTPLGTHEVNSLETLEPGGKYVAVTNIGRTGFKKLNYGELGVLKTSPRARKPRGMQFRNKLIVSGRARQEYEGEKLALKIIKVYRNGDEFQPSTRVLLKRKVLQDMELVLITCQEHMVLNSAIAALYTTDGKLVGDTKLFENGGMYVAVERRRPFFQHVNYGERGHVPLRRSGPVKLPPIGNGQMTGAKTKPPRKTKSVSPSKAKDALSTSPRAQETNSQLNPSRDLTPDHLGIEQAKLSYELESEADFNPSVSPPLRLDETPISDISKRTRAKVSEVQAEGPSVFEASGLQSEKAKAVRDTRDTAVEKPVDLLPAEEVVEDLEDAENEDDHNNSEQRESRSGSPANEAESDSDVESIPDDTENSHVTAEEPSQKAWGDEEQSTDAKDNEHKEQGNDSRGSTSHSRRASRANEEKSTAQEVEKADSIAASPPPERSGSSKNLKQEEYKEKEADSTSLGGSADVDSGKENEGGAENEDEAGKGDERRSEKRDEEGDEDANPKMEDNPKPSPDDNRAAENDLDAHAQDDKRSERGSAKEIHDKAQESDKNNNEK